jgi:hypothetical protein
MPQWCPTRPNLKLSASAHDTADHPIRPNLRVNFPGTAKGQFSEIVDTTETLCCAEQYAVVYR